MPKETGKNFRTSSIRAMAAAAARMRGALPPSSEMPVVRKTPTSINAAANAAAAPRKKTRATSARGSGRIRSRRRKYHSQKMPGATASATSTTRVNGGYPTAAAPAAGPRPAHAPDWRRGPRGRATPEGALPARAAPGSGSDRSAPESGPRQFRTGAPPGGPPLHPPRRGDRPTRGPAALRPAWSTAPAPARPARDPPAPAGGEGSARGIRPGECGGRDACPILRPKRQIAFARCPGVPAAAVLPCYLRGWLTCAGDGRHRRADDGRLSGRAAGGAVHFQLQPFSDHLAGLAGGGVHGHHRLLRGLPPALYHDPAVRSDDRRAAGVCDTCGRRHLGRVRPPGGHHLAARCRRHHYPHGRLPGEPLTRPHRLRELAVL